MTIGADICEVTIGADVPGETTDTLCCWEAIDEVPNEVNARKAHINASLAVADERGADMICDVGNSKGICDTDEVGTRGRAVAREVVHTVVAILGTAVTDTAVCVVPNEGAITKTTLRAADFPKHGVVVAPPDPEHSGVGCNWNGLWLQG